MKNGRVCFVAIVALTCSLAVSAEGLSVPDGEVVTLTDETVGAFDSANVAKGGTLVLDTTAAPTFAITGAGLIVKGNELPWSMTTANSTFTGSWDLKGAVTLNGVNPFGANNSNGYRVIATNNATLAIASDTTLYNMKILLGGTGFQNRGALEVDAFTSTGGHCFHNLVLSDDATVTMKPKSLVLCSGASIDLAGHKMSLVGGGDLQFVGCTISQNGEIEISGTSASATKLTFRSWNSTSTPSGGVTDTDDMVFTLAGQATIDFFNRYAQFRRPLHVRGTGNKLSHREQYVIDDDCHRAHMAWRGPIVFEGDDPAASTLEIQVINASKSGQASHCGFAIDGRITGNGSLIAYADLGSYLYLTNPENDFTGICRLSAGQLVLWSSGVIPDYARFARTAGTVLFASDDAGWSLAEVASFVGSSVNPSSPVAFSVDSETAETVFLPLAGAPLTGLQLSAPRGPVGFTGGSVEEHPLDLHWVSGIGELAGPMPYSAYRVRVNAAEANKESTLIVRNADLAISPDGMIGAGIGASALALSNVGRLVITNSLVRAADLEQKDASGYGTSDGSLVVGRNGYGMLEIEEGAVISNRLLVGMHTGDPWNGVSYGAVRQRGGKMVAVDPNGSTLKGNKLGGGQKNHAGYYELQGGELISHGVFTVGQYGYGIMQVNGGLFSVTNVLDTEKKGTLAFAAGNGGKGSLRVSGGTVRVYGGSDIWAGQGSTDQLHMLLTVDGPDALCDFGTANVYLGYASTGGFYYINLNGGVLRAKGVQKHSNKSIHTNNLYVVNFNGGTYKASASGYPFNATPAYSPNRIYVYEKGATIDTDEYVCRINTPIEGAAGKGVRSIALASPISHVMPPLVEIYGAGTGATACAHYDWDQHVIDRIDVISPGCGYKAESITAKLRVNQELMTLDASAIELAENDNAGSFTKAGSGELLLMATNTWGGATILAGGTLRCMCDRAIPAETTVAIAGGTLDMNGTVLANGEIAPKKWKVDAAAAKAREAAFSYGTELRFLEGATLEIENAEVLGDDLERIPLVDVPAGIVGTPTLLGTVDPAWRAVIGRNRITLNRTRGFVLFVR